VKYSLSSQGVRLLYFKVCDHCNPLLQRPYHDVFFSNYIHYHSCSPIHTDPSFTSHVTTLLRLHLWSPTLHPWKFWLHAVIDHLQSGRLISHRCQSLHLTSFILVGAADTPTIQIYSSWIVGSDYPCISSASHQGICFVKLFIRGTVRKMFIEAFLLAQPASSHFGPRSN